MLDNFGSCRLLTGGVFKAAGQAKVAFLFSCSEPAGVATSFVSYLEFLASSSTTPDAPNFIGYVGVREADASKVRAARPRAVGSNC